MPISRRSGSRGRAVVGLFRGLYAVAVNALATPFVGSTGASPIPTGGY